MRCFSFTITEHDPAKPWLVVGEVRRETVELEDGQEFYEWAGQHWPRSRFTVQLDPWQLGPS